MNKNSKGRIFLVDTEVIKDYSFINIVNLNEDDKVYLFKSPSSKMMDLDRMESLVKSKCSIEYLNANVSSYRLLSSYISFFIGTICNSLESELFVVSNDDVFDGLFPLIKEKCRVTLLDSDKLNEIELGVSECHYEDENEEVRLPNFVSNNVAGLSRGTEEECKEFLVSKEERIKKEIKIKAENSKQMDIARLARACDLKPKEDSIDTTGNDLSVGVIL